MTRQKELSRYKMKRIFLLSVLFIAYGLKLTAISAADTIYMKDNKEIKGIVLEDYKDRVLLSTVDGERTLMKSDIRELYFDTEEQNLIKLGEQAREKGDFIKAFVYYDKAFKINPNSKAAKEGIVFLQGYLFKKDIAKKEEDVNRRNEFEALGSGPVTIRTDEERLKEEIGKLRKTTGITLKSTNGVMVIDSVDLSSPAYDTGIRKGDLLIGIWGRLVGYLSLQEVIQRLLEKTSLETKCTIDRDVFLYANDIGADFKMQFDGLTVEDVKGGSAAEGAGLKQDDIITSISGQSTRYMPIKKAVKLIRRAKYGTINLTIRREIVMWGKEGG
jgi:hypothetical protein